MAKRILVVDDTDDVRKALSGLLVSEGYEVIQATDGSQVSDKVRKDHPDLILLDIIMPVMDGFDVLRMLKKDPQSKGIPVIVLSAATTGANLQRARLLGAADFVVKSSSPDVILGRVRAALASPEVKAG